MIKTEQEFLKRLQELEGGHQWVIEKYTLLQKVFDQQGCIAYLCKTPNEACCLPGTLEALRAEGVQIVILDSPEIYSNMRRIPTSRT